MQEPVDAEKPKNGDIIRAILFMIVAVNIFPFMNVAAKYLTDDYPIEQILWARYFGHFLFVIIMFMPKMGLALFKVAKPKVHIIRSCLIFISTVCFFGSLQWIDVPTASAINFTSPLLVTAFAVPFLGEVVGIRRWTAVVIGLCGALIIIRPGGESMHPAMLLVVGTSASYAAYQIFTRKFSATISPEASILYFALVGTVITTAVVPFYFVMPHSWIDAGLFFAIGAMGGFGHYMVIKALQAGEASVLSPFNYVQLVMATLLTYLVYDTLPDQWTVIGAVIIVGSGLYITYREAVKRRKR